MSGAVHLRTRGARNRSCAFLGVMVASWLAALNFCVCPRFLTGPSTSVLARPIALRAVDVNQRPSGDDDERHPHAGANATETFLLESLGLTTAQVAKVFRARHGLARHGAENLGTTVQWLSRLGVGDEDIPRILHQLPQFFDTPPETRDGMLRWLKEFGFSKLEIIKIATKNLGFFKTPRGTVETLAQWLSELGLDQSAIRALVERRPEFFNMRADTVKTKVRWLKGYGFSDPQIVHLISERTDLFTRSLDKSLMPRFALFEQQVSADELVDFVMTRSSRWLVCSMADCPGRIKQLLA